MPDIPQEILDKIIGYATFDELRVVGWMKFSNWASFVSHNFHQIILPYKFRSLTFRHHYYTSKTGTYLGRPTLSNPKFCKAINAGDAHAHSLAPLVQELNIFGEYPAEEMIEPLEIIIKGAISFRNLTNLRMENCATSDAIMQQLGKLVQLQSLHTKHCQFEEDDSSVYGALSNLQSLHTLECERNWINFRRHLTFIPMKNLRILKSNDLEVIETLLTSDSPVQLKELWILKGYWPGGDYSLLWNYIATATSLTHLSLPDLRLSDDLPSLIFSFQGLQYLHIHVALAPRFANQPLKEMKIDTSSEPDHLMVEVRQHWQGFVFPHVECLETDRRDDELDEIPIEFWREFLLNVNEVVRRHVFKFLDLRPSESMLISFSSFSTLDNHSSESEAYSFVE